MFLGKVRIALRKFEIKLLNFGEKNHKKITKKSPRFRFGEFLSFFFLKNCPRKPSKSFFHALFSCFGGKIAKIRKLATLN
jgi:hypothetical protein